MANRISPDQLPWDQLRAWGITREKMEKTGNVDRLVYGMYSTPVNFFKNEGGQRIEGEAAVRVYRSGDEWKIDMQTRCERPTVSDYIGVFGTALTDEQKKSLLEVGNAGSPVTVKDKDGKESQVLVSLNPETNRVVTFPLQYVTLPKESGIEGRLAGVSFSDEQKEKYLQGKEIYLVGMKNNKGESFDSCVQFSAYERRAVFTTPQWLKESRQAVRDIAKQEQQTPAAEAAKAEASEAQHSAGKGRSR